MNASSLNDRSSVHRYLVPLILLLLSFASFYENSLGINPENFRARHMGSDDLVLDGVMHARTGGAPLLGKFVRPDPATASTPEARYAAGDMTGRFDTYESSFGLQVHVFRLAAAVTGGSSHALHAVAAIALALLVVAFQIGITRLASPAAGIGFGLAIALSPWVSGFGSSLYWFEATWFLPAAIALLMGARAMALRQYYAAMLGLILIAFLIKFLCGYEYATTVVAATYSFVFLHALRAGRSIKALAGHALAIGVVAFVAFGLAMVMHAHAIGPTLAGGFDHIRETAEKRMSGSGGQQAGFLEKLCGARGDAEQVKLCKDEYRSSLNASPLKVVTRYFMMPHFIPWIDQIRENALASSGESDAAAIKSIGKAPSLGKMIDVARTVSFDGILALAITILSIVAFLAFDAFVFYLIWRQRSPLAWTTLLALLGSLSWFVAAKGHSFVHAHLNYVLWYLLYIPFGAALIVEWWRGRRAV
ncbi:hypothetical protein [Sphingomonas montanisoli]|uniref:Glycosyltransferase family 39 protein n=1 Tax=Sphingomonas montanisoli TaxID=2606412 RepID=A0A5D9C4D2_9SPHN|nr:hypothetical protein [Sphingomonas montanisoli]TZG25860.1 hypothetical protein FYJ91_12830 [Sphingomonas montanisoli]